MAASDDPGEDGEPSWNPDDSGEPDGPNEPVEDSGADPTASGRSAFPSVTVELSSGRLALSGVVRALSAASIVAAGGALYALAHEARTGAELLALLALVV